MSVIVRPVWSPPAPHGSYAILGDRHPELPDYVWVEWIDSDGRGYNFPNGERAEGYYPKRYLIRVGTRLFSNDTGDVRSGG